MRFFVSDLKIVSGDDACLSTGICRENMLLNGCSPCGERCIVQADNCDVLGGKWLFDQKSCDLNYGYDQASCHKAGGLWQSEGICDFVQYCNQ